MSDRAMIDVLVVAAHLPELEGLRPLLGTGLRAQVGRVRVAALPVGIGLCDAAAGASAALREYLPRAVVQIGTCGVYFRRRESGKDHVTKGDSSTGNLTVEVPSAESVGDSTVRAANDGRDPAFGSGQLAGDRGGPTIGDVVVARRVHLVSVAAMRGQGLLPLAMRHSAEADALLSKALASPRVSMAEVATTLAITTEYALAEQIARRGCDVEHLEAFAVLRACAARAVPFAAVLGIANEVGPQAHEQWRTHHLAAGTNAAEHVSTWLEAGAPGLPHRLRG